MKDIKNLPINTKVKFGPDFEFKGKITAICIREPLISYEISYWKEAEIKTLWLIEEDLKLIKSSEKNKVGFINEEVL